MTAAFLGLVAGAGAWLAYLGWRPRPAPLGQALSRLQETAAPVPASTAPSVSWDVRLGALAMGRVTLLARALQRARTDLRIIGRSPEEQAGRIVVYGMFGLFLGPWLGVVGWMAGSNLSPTLLGGVSLIGAAIGVVSPWASVQNEAKARRRDFLLALAAWCDMLSMCLAAGRGIEQSVTTAAAEGEGPAFNELRGALSSGHIRDATPWESLEMLGAELGIEDLRELGSTITLAGEDGAAVREAVATKALTIRERITSDTERAAESATAQMGMPTFAVALGFLVFIGYPALAAFARSGF